jgi:tol-pal system protein YbgF
MMRTMLNRIAFAAVACCCCVVAGLSAADAQVGNADVMLRVDRLENQIRQLTGQVEQLQYRNQQLESALKRLQEDAEFRFQELGARGGPRVAAPRTGTAPTIQPPVSGSGRRSDAFDPSENPAAPGAPRVLGSLPSQLAPATLPRNDAGIPTTIGDDSLARGSTAGASPRGPAASAPLSVATASPSTPRDFYDLGYGYLQRKEYALAEDAFRDFLKKYPSDKLAAEAQYGLGESLFFRQSYHDAANAFVVMSKKYETSTKAPEALLRLGQSLAAINEKELACVAFGDVGRKYPRAAPNIKQLIEREQKRVRC